MALDKKLISLVLIILGILGMIGAAVSDIIRGRSEIVMGTIEYGGIGLGVVLLLIGVVLFIMKPKAAGEAAPETPAEAPAEAAPETTGETPAEEEAKEGKKEEYECPSCGATVPGDATVCPECGEEFEE